MKLSEIIQDIKNLIEEMPPLVVGMGVAALGVFLAFAWYPLLVLGFLGYGCWVIGKFLKWFIHKS